MERENNGGKGHDWKSPSHFNTTISKTEHTTPSYTQEEQENRHDRTHQELVCIIRNDVEQARARKAKFGYSFDPVMYLGEQLSWQNTTKGGLECRNSTIIQPITDHLPDVWNHLPKLLMVWDLISLPYIKHPHDRWRIEGVIKDYGKYFRPMITLNPQEQRLLDAMAEAVGIPPTRAHSELAGITLYRPDGDPLPATISNAIVPRQHEADTNSQFTDKRACVKETRYRRFGSFHVDTRKANRVTADYWTNMNNLWDSIPTEQ